MRRGLHAQDKLAVKGRKMVTIVDPHIKRDNGYKVHNSAQNKYYVLNKDGTDYEGDSRPFLAG